MSSKNEKNGVDENTSSNARDSQNGYNDSNKGSNTAKESPDKLKIPGDVHLSPEKSPDVSFEHLSCEDAVRENTFTELMQKMASKQYNICENEESLIYGKCKLLFEKDYVCKTVINCNYSMNYPIRIIIPVGKKRDVEGSSVDFDETLYTKLVKGAPEARLRSRFIVPVMLFDNRFICRSGTLTVKLSAVYEMVVKPVQRQNSFAEDDSGIFRAVSETIYNLGSVAFRTVQSLIDWNSMSVLFEKDAEIMKYLKIERVFDLMVEYSKLFIQMISVSSTEKAHEDKYGEIKLEELPYPGCEFFASYHNADRKLSSQLSFDWEQSDVTRGLKLTNQVQCLAKINVEDHKKWDLIQLTQNYLKIMLSCLVTGTGGILIHCISGWDRTPLFVSLVRLSLWADGVVHETLEYEDMAYLTVAYDWFLFGHNLPNRIQKGEEIMHFCFNFLEHITSDEFSITRLFQELPDKEKRNRTFPEFVPGRRLVLNKIRSCVLEHYELESGTTN